MKSSNLILTGSDILDNLYESRKACFSAYFFSPHPFLPLSTNVGVSQSCFDFVAAIFRLRKSLDFNISISQAEGAVEKPLSYEFLVFMNKFLTLGRR